MDIGDFIQTHFRGAINPAFVKGWRARGMERLLPFQERTARAFAIETAHHAGRRSGRNTLVVAPTSAGKTFLAELEMALHLSAGRRAAFLVPTRALAGQKSAEFTRWLEPVGLRVVCASRDHPETDPRVASGDFDLLVAVYEKMNQYTAAHPQTVFSMGGIVVDEVQMIGDRERGGLLDLLLTKLCHAPDAPRILALSAVVNRQTAFRLASWLDAEIYEERARPVDLREGVLDIETGLFSYKDTPTGEAATEWLGSPEELERLVRNAAEVAAERTGDGDPADTALVATAALLAGRGESVLLFAPTRRCSRNWAEWLAEMEGGFTPARLALPRLHSLEPGRTRDLLERCLARGVAFHNADLDEAERQLVEEAFNAGEIQALVATPTLAMGVNLAARNVLHSPWRYAGGGDGGRACRLPLGRARFCNQGGRAARLGLGADFGRSLLVARSKTEVQRLWESLVTPEPESPDAPLSAADLPALCLDLLTGSDGRSAEQLAGVIEKTFSSRQSRDQAIPSRSWRPSEEVRAGLGVLAGAELVRPLPASGGQPPGATYWRLTGFGELAGSLGLAPDAALQIREWLGKLRVRVPCPSEFPSEDAFWIQAFHELAMTDEGRRARAGLGGSTGWFRPCEWEGVKADAGAMLAAECIRRAGGFSRDESMAFRTALMLRDWIAGVDMEEIEARHRVLGGALARTAEEFEWLLRGAVALAPLAGLEADFAAGLARLASRVRLGVGEDALPLAALRIPGLGRSRMLRLAQAGLADPDTLASTPAERLSGLVGLDAAHAIGLALANRQRQPPMDSTGALPMSEAAGKLAASPPPPQAEHSPLIEINLQSPGVIRAGGREVALPPRSFDLLALLAERPGEVVTREAIYQRLWPEGGPEPQQIDGHRRTLIRRLTPALRAEAAAMAEVIRGIGLRMRISPHHVCLRR